MPYPGFGAEWGFIVSAVAMVLISVVLYLAFRHRDWI